MAQGALGAAPRRERRELRAGRGAREIGRRSTTADAVLIGPGIVDRSARGRLVRTLLKQLDGKVVLDLSRPGAAGGDPARDGAALPVRIAHAFARAGSG